MYGYIYITTNNLNNKKYIGRHKSSEFDSSYYGSGKIITQSIEKNGLENFTVKILEPVNGVSTVCESLEQLCDAEEYYIDYYDCVNSKEYYNLIPGGLGGSVKGVIGVHNNQGSYKFVLPDELENYLADGYMIGGISQSPEVVAARVKKNTGKKRAAETRARMSKAQKGHFVSEETRRKYSESHKGKTTSKKGKIAITLSSDEDYQIYIYPNELEFYESLGFVHAGKKHKKEESREKHRQAKIDTTLINNGFEEKCIKKSELDSYLELGWVHARLPEHIMKINPNKGKTLLYFEGRRHYVNPEEVEYLLSIGYTKNK